jgi:polyphosphate kinase 2 (PPK2 family)
MRLDLTYRSKTEWCEMTENDANLDGMDWLKAELEDAFDEDFELELSEPALSIELRKIYKKRHPQTLDRATYFKSLLKLQAELIKLQDWVQATGEKIAVIFEGRDAAGKGGVIKRITQRLNPRVCRVVALSKPTERERTQWYFQRYVPHLPSGGEIVLFDRSWYNRSGVERVMGFATPEQVEQFFQDVPEFEQMLVRSGIRLIKYWFSITDEEPDGPAIAGALGGLHQGQGRDLRPHEHPRVALVHRRGQRQEACAAELHPPPARPDPLQRGPARADQPAGPPLRSELRARGPAAGALCARTLLSRRATEPLCH